MTQYTENPPWVDKILSKHWYELQDRVGLSMMPVCKVTKKGTRKDCTEYGCGHYGCVLPTSQRGVVCKVTSDPTEAAFVAAALQIKPWPDGIVKYYNIVRTPDTYRRRPVYIIWRAEAVNVGKMTVYTFYNRYDKKYGKRGCREFIDNLIAFRSHASLIKNKIMSSKNPYKLINDSNSSHDFAWDLYVSGRVGYNKPPVDIAFRKIILDQISEVMANTHCGYLVGDALNFYLNRGMVLADVHLGNIGELTPPDFSSWELVITDPGHMVPVDTKWLNIEIPAL